MIKKQEQQLEGFELSNEDKGRLTDFDVEVGKRLGKEQQFEIKNEKDIFSVFIYCLLSSAEKALRADKFYRLVDREGFLNPEKLLNVLENENLSEKEMEIKKSFFKLRGPNRRKDRLIGFIKGWQTKQGQVFAQDLLDDILNERTGSNKFRDIIAKSVPRLSFKSASYLLNKIGYDDVIPIDVGETRFLKDLYYPEIIEPDYETVGSITNRDLYLKYEETLKEAALEKGLSPGVFHCVVWGKYAKGR